jgi:hypothetical protein
VIEQSKLHVCIVRWQTLVRCYRRWCSKIWAVLLSSAFVVLGNNTQATDRPVNEQRLAAPPANSAPVNPTPQPPANPPECLSEGGGFLRAKLTGSIKAELNWSNRDMECSGATRPNGGVRMRFSHAFGKGDQRLVFLFGIPGLREGADARELPVNVTVIREGAGEFYGTRGDNKCLIDRLKQESLAGIPLRNRRYRITVSGFCTQPARAIAGEGSVLITRFDFAGRVDYSEEDSTTDERVVAGGASRPSGN